MHAKFGKIQADIGLKVPFASFYPLMYKVANLFPYDFGKAHISCVALVD